MLIVVLFVLASVLLLALLLAPVGGTRSSLSGRLLH